MSFGFRQAQSSTCPHLEPLRRLPRQGYPFIGLEDFVYRFLSAVNTGAFAYYHRVKSEMVTDCFDTGGSKILDRSIQALHLRLRHFPQALASPPSVASHGVSPAAVHSEPCILNNVISFILTQLSEQVRGNPADCRLAPSSLPNSAPLHGCALGYDNGIAYLCLGR